MGFWFTALRVGGYWVRGLGSLGVEFSLRVYAADQRTGDLDTRVQRYLQTRGQFQRRVSLGCMRVPIP